ncbi:MAG: low-specificity L-threonine aldolase [Thermoanaerobacteraceae bacterium]
MKYIDLRSDTVTIPTDEMRKAMYKAEVGDDVYREDPTIIKLEEMAAEMFGKEAALLVTSGTQGNQVSVMTHTHPGQEIIVEENSHIITYEVGGIGYLSGVQTKALKSNKGVLNPADVEKAIRHEDIHYPKTSLICLENTHNRAGGTVTPVEIMKEIYEIAKNHDLPVHLDGARIFNAATYLNTNVKEIAKYADSIMFCLSKGLCAPIGSVIVGKKDFIERARKYRKMLGGGMRQAGFIAAAGIIALEKMTNRLQEDHDNARFLAEGLINIPGIDLDIETVQTNIIMTNISGTGMTGKELALKLKEYDIIINGGNDSSVRFVTHYYITKKDIEKTIKAIEKIVRKA